MGKNEETEFEKPELLNQMIFWSKKKN